ncbi:MAG TPA: hypothetical protein ENH24_04385 [Nitrospirae bacterium]|nr:hypothetical protein [Nitrospirota bacterium]
MKKIEVKIETLQPVILAELSGDVNLTGTRLYIPGTSIRGVFAKEYIKTREISEPHNDDNFYRWFLDGSLIFTNAYLKCGNKQYLPCPLSLQKKKGDEGHVYNIFIQEGIEDTKPCSGYIYAGNSDNGNLEKKSPETVMFFHHARDNRIKGHSTEGKIFYYEAVKEDQVFSASIIGEEKELKEFCNTFSGAMETRIGRSRNTQYGLVRMSCGGIEDYEVELEEGKEFVLTLTSPAVFYNDSGYPDASTEIMERYLSEIIGCSVTIEKAFSKTTTVENFVGIWNLKTPRETAFAEGSTFSVKLSSYEDKTNENLTRALINGIGEKTYLGFGRFLIDWIKRDSYSISPEREIPVRRPSNFMPDTVKNIFSEIVKNKLIRLVETSALGNVGKFKSSRPTNSLLGRLELMLKHSENIREFENKLRALRKPAMEALENCKKDGESLLEILQKEERVIRETDMSLVEPVLSECELKIEDFIEEIYRTYWLTIFKWLRKEKNE